MNPVDHSQKAKRRIQVDGRALEDLEVSIRRTG
jgi:hypothetical protein